MSHIKERFQFYTERIKSGRLKEMLYQTKWIYNYAKRYWPHMIFYTLLGMGSTVIGLISSLISKDLVDIITGHKTGELIQTFCIMIGMAVSSIIVNQITSYFSSWISMKVDAEIKSEIFQKIMVTDWESLTTYHTGDLLTRWGSDASNISNGVLSFIPNLIIYTFQFIGALGMVIYYDWTFAIFAMIGIPFSLIMSKTLINRMRSNNERSAAMNAKMSGFNQETFFNVQTIKAFDLIKLYVDRLKQLQKEYIEMKLEFNKMSMATSIILGLVGLLVTYSSYGWGIYRVWSGAISYGTMTMFLSLSGTLTSTVNSLSSMIPSAISLTTSAGRLIDIVDMPREDYTDFDQAKLFLDAHRQEGIALKFQDVDFSYKTGKEVFNDASFEAYPHEIIGFVGPSGEGKTTMLRLLLSLIHESDGRLYVESQGEKLSLSPSTRQLFSYVPQGNTLLSGTIAENMRTVKPDATDQEIKDALELSCALDFVNSLEDGINTKLGEKGGGLSEGQAQRIAIARALLRKSPILLLDEASSALDVKTERTVLRNIMQDTYPRVCIVTTHRPTVLNLCHRVYSIQNKSCITLNQDQIDILVKDF